jgi:hypothetical protein
MARILLARNGDSIGVNLENSFIDKIVAKIDHAVLAVLKPKKTDRQTSIEGAEK